jgi:hypothetical protein
MPAYEQGSIQTYTESILMIHNGGFVGRYADPAQRRRKTLEDSRGHDFAKVREYSPTKSTRTKHEDTAATPTRAQIEAARLKIMEAVIRRARRFAEHAQEGFDAGCYPHYQPTTKPAG